MRFANVLALCFAAAALLPAQQDRGTIFGTVADAQGAAVMGASVRVVNVGTDWSAPLG